MTLSQGATSYVSFIQTTNPTANTTATITATYGGRQGSAVLTVNHTDGLVIDTSKIHFVLAADGSVTVIGAAGAVTGGVPNVIVDVIDNTNGWASRSLVLNDDSGAFSTPFTCNRTRKMMSIRCGPAPVIPRRNGSPRYE